MSRVLELDRNPRVRVANLTVKALLVAAFAVALTVPLSVLEGKAMGFRAPLFLAPVVIVPEGPRRPRCSFLGVHWFLGAQARRAAHP